MKRFLIFLIVLAIVGGAIWYSMTRRETSLVLTGIVTTDDLIVSAQIQGRLGVLKVDRGDIVKKGDLVAVIHPEQWQADMAVSESNELQMTRQVAQGEANLRLSELQTKNQIAEAKANLSAAQSLVKQGEADRENAQLTFTHEESLFKKGSESQQVYDQARTNLAAQQARVESLKRQVEASQAVVELAKANQEQVASRRATLDMQKQQLAAATAQKDKSKIFLDYTKVFAPVDGIVDVRAARQGEVVNPAQPIVTLIDQDNLWVRVDVEETYIDRIHLNDVLKVRLPSGATRDGTVFFRAVDADYATQRDVSRTKRDIKTFEVRLRCDNKNRALAVGMTAYVDVPLESAATPTAPATQGK